MPTVDPVLRRYAFADDLGLTREQYLRTPPPSQLCDDLDAADTMRGLERLPSGHRIDDVARVFRAAVHDAATDPRNRRASELVVACVHLARRTVAELEVDAELAERETHLAASVVLEAERIVRRLA